MVTSEVAPGIFLIDTKMLGFPQSMSAYLLRGDCNVLIDTGPASSLPTLLEGISELGLQPKDLTHIIATHIHIDHFGAAGYLVNDLESTEIIVHENGAQHLIDPRRLKKSAERIFGERLRYYGDVKPINKEKITSLKGGETLNLGKWNLKTIWTPGHAQHNICVFEENSKILFSGDSAGVFYQHANIFAPTSPPPNFNFDFYKLDLKRMRELNPSIICYAHFGPATPADELLQKASSIADDWIRIIENYIDQGKGIKETAEHIIKKMGPKHMIFPKQMIHFMIQMNVAGMVLDLRRKTQDQAK